MAGGPCTVSVNEMLYIRFPSKIEAERDQIIGCMATQLSEQWLLQSTSPQHSPLKCPVCEQVNLKCATYS